MIKVNKGISIPKSASIGTKAKYPFRAMETGDSFLVPSNNPTRAQKHMSSIITYWKGKLPGRTFTTRCVEGGVRIWRTS